MRYLTKEWFSFSKNERKAILLLVLLLLALLLTPLYLRYYVAPNAQVANVEHLREQAQNLNEPPPPQYDELHEVVETPTGARRQSRQPATFAFNPNAIGRDSLLLLGFSERQAAAIINFRARSPQGFRSAEQFLNLNVVTDQQRRRLQGFVLVPPREPTHLARGDTARREAARRYAAGNDTATRRFAPRPQPAAVELNTADTALLRTLPGVPAFIALRIVRYREELGGYAAAEQLLEVRGFDEERLQRLQGRITVDAAHIKKFELSEENQDLMRRHPYIDAYTARGIAQYARRKGGPASLDELLKNNILTDTQVQKLTPYVLYQP